MGLKEAMKNDREINIQLLSNVSDWVKNHPLISIICILLISVTLFIVGSSVFLFNVLSIVFLAIGLFLSFLLFILQLQMTTANPEGLKPKSENLAIPNAGQIDEFNIAVENLSYLKDEIKMSGICTLERKASEYNQKYWDTVKILTTYISRHSSNENDSEENQYKISWEIQEILYVIGRIGQTFEEFGEKNAPHLEKTFLRRADLNKANLKRAHLESANLIEAELKEAHLENANLKGAKLDGANFEEAHLEGAILDMTYLEKAHLEKAYLVDAKLTYAYLKGASLKGAHLENSCLIYANLENAFMMNAHLKGAILAFALLLGADLKDADFEDADLSEANLKGVHNLSPEQLCKVKTLYNARLDEEIYIPLKKKYPALFEEPKG